MDIVTIICFVLSMVTWRNVSMVMQLSTLDTDAAQFRKSQEEDHATRRVYGRYLQKQKLLTVKVWQTALNVLLDIPFLLMGLLAGGTLFRLPALVAKLQEIANAPVPVPDAQAEPASHANTRACPCNKQGCCDDSSDCCYCCCCSGASFDCCDGGLEDCCDKDHLSRMWHHRSFKTDWKWRKACAKQAGIVLLDVLMFVLAAIIVCTLWRLYPMVTEVAKKVKSGSHAKARKAVVKHFGLLLVDLVAMPCFFVCLFSWRSFGLLGSLFASGDFFTFFAITTLTEFVRFLIDIPVSLVFVMMVFLRPFQSWTLLLEDGCHSKHRKIQEKVVAKYMLELLDAVRPVTAPITTHTHTPLYLLLSLHLLRARARALSCCLSPSTYADIHTLIHDPQYRWTGARTHVRTYALTHC